MSITTATTVTSQTPIVHSIATLYPSVYHSASLSSMPPPPHSFHPSSHSSSTEPEIILRTPRTSRFQPTDKKAGGKPISGSQSARDPLPDINRPPTLTVEQYFLNPAAAAPIMGSPPPPPMPFISASDSQLTTQQLSAKLNQNMLSNAYRSPQATAALNTPLSPRVARALHSHQTIHMQQQQLFPPQQPSAAFANSPMRPGISTVPIVGHSSNGQAFFSFQSTSPQHATNGQLVLPAEFVAQQQAKLLAQKQAELTAADGNAPSAERDAQILQQAKAYVDSMLHPPFNSNNSRSPSRSPRRSPHHRSLSSPTHAKIVPARVPDVAYGNMKKRSSHLLQQFKHAATETSSRASAVQLEMRGSVRFDMSNPDKIFEALRKQAEKPVDDTELNFNEKHTIMNKDGTQTVVFGRLHERPDSVREASISEFFVAKAANTNMPTLERFVSQNYQRDRHKMQKEFGQKNGPGAARRKERTEEELLAAPDEELTPLEKWKRDQLRIKQAKAEAQEAAMREHRARQNELLKLRLEKERFEREEREQYEKEQAVKAAKEEEERLWRESEKQRLYRETVQEQAEQNKQLKAEAEQAKKRAEEEARKREEEKRRKMNAGEGGFSYMKPLTKASRTAEEEVLVARVKDTEKDWAIARAKLKAEITRVGELVQRREKAQQKMLIVAARLAEKESSLEGTMSNVVSAEETAAKFRDNSEFKDSIRKLRMNNLQATEENRLRELEKIENECRLAYEKAAAALEAAETKAAAGGGETSFGRSTTFTKRPPAAGGGGTLSTSNSQALLSHVASVRSIRSGADSDRGIDEEDNHDDNASAAGDDAASETSTAAPSAVGSPVKVRRTRRAAAGEPSSSPQTRPRSNSNAASRSGSKSRGVSPSADRDGASPATKSRRVSATAGEMNQLNLEEDRLSAAASGAPSEAVSPPLSGFASPAGGTEGDVAAAATGTGEGEEPSIVNERTLAIDAARAQMVSQQAEFEARIKALTSFSTSSPPAGKKKGRKASISVNKATSPPVASSRRATHKPKKNSILPVFNKDQINASAQGRSPDASDGEDDADAKLMRSLALANVEEQLAHSDQPAQ